MVQEWKKDGFVLSTDQLRLQPDRIHKFLSTQAYWCLDIPLSIVKKAIKGSLCFGLFRTDSQKEIQIGFARIVTDGATFAWICDVYIEAEARGQGLSKWMMECAMSHPELKNLRRICLATKDAHLLYQKYGFEVTLTPQNWMEIKDNDLYKKLQLTSTDQ